MSMSLLVGIGAEIIMYCVKRCLGPKICNADVIHIFVKFFSRMLEIMLPLSIESEMKIDVQGCRPRLYQME